MNSLEAVDPLLTLRSLSADIEHVICELAEVEERLGNASGSETGA